MPMFELNGLSKQLLGNYAETEILFARQSGETSAYINYTEDNGMIIAVSDSTITLLPDSQIIIKAGDANVKLAQGKVYIGSENHFDDDVTINKTKYEMNGEEGTIALIGPKRMEYDRVITLLDYIKQNIDDQY